MDSNAACMCSFKDASIVTDIVLQGSQSSVFDNTRAGPDSSPISAEYNLL